MKSLGIHTSFYLLISLCLFISCDESSEMEFPELIYNRSFEEGDQNPFDWYTNLSDYQHAWSDSIAFDGVRSLMLTSDVENGSFGHWWHPFSENIPYGKKVKLSCYVKLDNISGKGVSLAFRGDNKNQEEVFYYSTQDITPIKGSIDWMMFSIEMDQEIPESVTLIFVYLILQDNTKGTVFFDDISMKTF